MSDNPFDFLIPLEEDQDRWDWATVEGVGPLRVRFDGETIVQDATPDVLVARLFVGDRVRVHRSGLRMIVVGRAGGQRESPPPPPYTPPEDTGWVEFSYNSGYPYPGHGAPPAVRKIGDMVYLRGRWERRSGDGNFGESAGGYGLLTLDSEFRPAYTTRQIMSGQSGAGSMPYIQAEISTNGVIRAWLNGTTPWVGGDFWWSTI